MLAASDPANERVRQLEATVARLETGVRELEARLERVGQAAEVAVILARAGVPPARPVLRIAR